MIAAAEAVTTAHTHWPAATMCTVCHTMNTATAPAKNGADALLRMHGRYQAGIVAAGLSAESRRRHGEVRQSRQCGTLEP